MLLRPNEVRKDTRVSYVLLYESALWIRHGLPKYSRHVMRNTNVPYPLMWRGILSCR